MDATVLDTKGLRCPLPVLRTRKAMKAIAAGEVIEVHATDPDSASSWKAGKRTVCSSSRSANPDNVS
jgi:tRNA 2-thiouridine synthesizing protein A